MKRFAVAVAVALGAVVVAAAPAAADDSGSTAVRISLDTATTTAVVGDPFSFTTTVENAGGEPLPGLVAHLDVISVEPEVYVDPEDWSSQRTQFLPPVPAHGSLRLPWTVHAVNSGRFVVHVVLVSPTGDAVTAGPALHARVSARQTLDAAGVLPVAVGTPLVLLTLLIAARYRRRRLI